MPRKQPRRTKYHSCRTVVDGITFDSRKEARRYQELVLLARAGQILDLAVQVPFVLHAGSGQIVGRYVADFTYREGHASVVEDVKGFKTDLYRWKKRHMVAEYGIQIRET